MAIPLLIVLALLSMAVPGQAATRYKDPPKTCVSSTVKGDSWNGVTFRSTSAPYHVNFNVGLHGTSCSGSVTVGEWGGGTVVSEPVCPPPVCPPIPQRVCDLF